MDNGVIVTMVDRASLVKVTVWALSRSSDRAAIWGTASRCRRATSASRSSRVIANFTRSSRLGGTGSPAS
jgi:hypothetical protein